MASITLKTIKRKTSVSRAKIREAVSAAYAKPLNAVREPALVKITKTIPSKTKTVKD
jgi:hypothetical protein